MKQRIIAAAIFALFAFTIPANAQKFQADSNISVSSTIVAANTTAIVITTKPGTVYSIDGFNNGTTLAYIKLYNAASATCGSGTPIARYMIPFGTSSAGGGFGISNINGDAYVNGITMCVTGGIADNDTTNPTNSEYIVNVHWKALPK
jgi:hypothetical protein